MHSYRDTRFSVVPLTLLPIAGTPNTITNAFTASVSTEYIKMYLAIAVFARIDIIYKQVINMAKDV